MTLINLEKAIEYSKEKDYIKTSSQEKALREVFEFAKVQAVSIPDNATNGDVIKAMFPKCMWNAIGQDEEWWNTPYEGSDVK